MVSEAGQIYTIEGVAAGALMLVTAYLVVSTTTVLTPQDVHIVDMQLQQLGNDALAMMDMPDQYGQASNLSLMVATNNTTGFHSEFLSYLNASTGSGPTVGEFAYEATLHYRNSTGVYSLRYNQSQDYLRENAVTASRWVYLQDFDPTPYATHPDSPQLRAGTQSALMEVLVWRA